MNPSVAVVAQVVFWSAALAFVHSYLLYPLIVFLLARRGAASASTDRQNSAHPKVSLLVAAYNEELVIRRKVENCLALRYPGERIEIVIASDGSTDHTMAIAEEYSSRGVRVLAYPLRRGKPATLDRAVLQTDGDILVFSDANTLLDADAIEMLVRHFADERIGAVCGELILESPGGSGREEERYWRYEQRLKATESAAGTALGANGGIYAIRRGLFEPLPDNLLIDDFVIPMRAVEKGFRVAYDRQAVAREETAPDAAAEFRRRVRIGAGGFQAIWLLRRLLNPRRGFVCFAFFSHKVLRWLGPFLLLAAFLSSLLLASRPIYALAVILQLGFYGGATAGALIEQSGRSCRLLRPLYYFVMINLALAVGFVRWLRGTQHAAWERTARRQAN